MDMCAGCRDITETMFKIALNTTLSDFILLVHFNLVGCLLGYRVAALEVS